MRALAPLTARALTARALTTRARTARALGAQRTVDLVGTRVLTTALRDVRSRCLFRYGSPAKSAAKERDRLQIELERERAERVHGEETISVLHEELERAHARVAELMAQISIEENMKADLDRTRRALRAAQTNAALGLLQPHAQARTYNPIAAPRHQFGSSSSSGMHATSGSRPRASFGRSAAPMTGRH